MNCSLSGSFVHEISQARILEWFAISSSGGSSQSRVRSASPTLAGRLFTTEPPGKPGREQGVQVEQENKIGHELITVGAGWWVHEGASYCQLLFTSGRLWCRERLRAGEQGNSRGWDGWMASPTQCTWVWANSRSWWWTGRPGVLQSMGLQRAGTWLSNSTTTSK